MEIQRPTSFHVQSRFGESPENKQRNLKADPKIWSLRIEKTKRKSTETTSMKNDVEPSSASASGRIHLPIDQTPQWLAEHKPPCRGLLVNEDMEIQCNCQASSATYSQQGEVFIIGTRVYYMTSWQCPRIQGGRRNDRGSHPTFRTIHKHFTIGFELSKWRFWPELPSRFADNVEQRCMTGITELLWSQLASHPPPHVPPHNNMK